MNTPFYDSRFALGTCISAFAIYRPVRIKTKLVGISRVQCSSYTSTRLVRRLIRCCSHQSWLVTTAAVICTSVNENRCDRFIAMHFFRQRKRHYVKSTRISKSDNAKSSASENKYHKEFSKLKKSITCWNDFFTVSEQERVDNWPRLEVLGNAMCEKYAWAVPNNRTLSILKHFSPLIEIGAGKGYFCKLLTDMGVDIIAFDREVDSEHYWGDVQIGGPKKLLKNLAKGRNLFLCYPDEDNSMACPCLNNFDGEYLIHIGELISTGQLSSPQAPWGRTSGADFQVALMTEFHCVLVSELPAFPFSRDCLTVWKRTTWVRGKESIEKEMNLGANRENDDNDNSKEDRSVGEEDDAWASIPPNERLPVTRAAPELQFLLQ